MTEPATPVTKALWTDADVDAMSWHDAAVHAMAFEPALPFPGRLLVDLGYIVEWVEPDPPATGFSFWVSPATLVFESASDLIIDVDLTGPSFELSLDALTGSVPDEHGIRTWVLTGHQFTAQVRVGGFRQHLRRRPVLAHAQRVTTDQRGGITFDERSFI